MTRREVMLEDLRPNPDDLRKLAEQLDQLRDAPPPYRPRRQLPRAELGNGIFLEGDWKDGPTVRIVKETE